MKVTSIAVSELKLEGSNVRSRYTEQGLKELKASVYQYGICVPLIALRSEAGVFVLDGGRRLYVARELGLSEVPVVLVDGADAGVAALAWVANFEREAVPFMEESRWFGALVRSTGVAVEQMGVSLGRSAGYVRSRLAVLDWPGILLSYCDSSSISYSVAREYARLGESVELERALDWDKINGPSYRQAVAYVDEILRAREIVVRPEMVVEAPVLQAPTCQACGGERDPVTSRTLIVCRACLDSLGV